MIMSNAHGANALTVNAHGANAAGGCWRLMRRMLERRVVVTGVGLVTPLGIGVEKNWDALMAGRSGIGPITRFDASDFPARNAGEGRDFYPEDWIEKRDIKKM